MLDPARTSGCWPCREGLWRGPAPHAVRAPIDEARPESRRHPAVPENFRNPPQTTLSGACSTAPPVRGKMSYRLTARIFGCVAALQWKDEAVEYDLLVRGGL